jgi:hypothetical protein
MATGILSLPSPLVNICVSHAKFILKSKYGIVKQLRTQNVENQDNRSELQKGSKMCCHRTEMFGFIGCEILELLLRVQQLLILPVILPATEEHRCWASLKSH